MVSVFFASFFSAFSRAPSHKWIKAIKKSLAKTEKSVLIEIENTSELFSFYSISVLWRADFFFRFFFLLSFTVLRHNISTCYFLLATYLYVHIVEREREREYLDAVISKCVFFLPVFILVVIVCFSFSCTLQLSIFALKWKRNNTLN